MNRIQREIQVAELVNKAKEEQRKIDADVEVDE